MKLEQTIFKRGSRTYYFASQFLPKNKRDDVYQLYSYVRIMDDFVDARPQQPQKLIAAEKMRRKGRVDERDTHLSATERQVVNNIIKLKQKYQFDERWLKAFYQSMLWDVEGKAYVKLDDTLAYIYGSAEVIGLMMARILCLPKQADKSAQLLGRAMQYINFLRDIDEDNKLGRCYFSQQDLKRFDLKNLSKTTAKLRPAKFKEFVYFQLSRYQQWLEEAEKGLYYLKKSDKVAVKTAIDGYHWTAEQIKQDPLIVFQTKVKPSKKQLLLWTAKNAVR